jgi:hypothetical protein
MTEPHVYADVMPLGRLLRESAAENDATANVRRKNYELDQHRIDRVKEVFGAATETEAITRALDLALEMNAFANEVRRGGEAMYGKGDGVHYFDDESGLDFSGFVREPPAKAPVAARRHGKRERR